MTGWMIRNKATGLFYTHRSATWAALGKLYPKIGFAKNALAYHENQRWKAGEAEVVEVDVVVIVKAD